MSCKRSTIATPLRECLMAKDRINKRASAFVVETKSHSGLSNLGVLPKMLNGSFSVVASLLLAWIDR